MRDPWISEPDALRERMSNPAQVSAGEPQAALPPYATSFLAHLRLLVGVPFEYLVPDAAMLPDESIRFFHLDRAWTDRLIDGVLAVGAVGSREQAHYHTAGPALAALLDSLEPAVRPAQRGLGPLTPAPGAAGADPAMTGFLLRSALVSGWPQLEVRAYRSSVKLPLLRLERLSTAILIALFAGVPDRVRTGGAAPRDATRRPHRGTAARSPSHRAGRTASRPRPRCSRWRFGAPIPRYGCWRSPRCAATSSRAPTPRSPPRPAVRGWPSS